MGPGGFFPANPNLANILSDTDFDFDDFCIFLIFVGSQISGLGPAWAHPLEPSLGPPTWAWLGPRLGPTRMGPASAHPRGPGLGPSHLGPARHHLEAGQGTYFPRVLRPY